MNSNTEHTTATGRDRSHVRDEECASCDSYVQTFRSVLLPVVGRAVTAALEPIRPADVLARIRAGAHRRGHALGLLG